jgi:hypothetical protein
MNRLSMNDTNWKINYHDNCEICDSKSLLDQCNRCGTSVCLDDKCSMIFPHKYNTNYVICKGCIQTIESKLKLQLNRGDLKLLKSKIRQNKTKRAMK